MSRTLAIFFLCFCGINGFSQSPAYKLKRLSDSLSVINAIKQEKIKQFKAARTSSSNDTGELITDIRPDGLPVYRSVLNANAAITTGAARLQSGILGISLSGKGQVIGVWDDGKVHDHIELGNRVISNEVITPQFHITHVTGTLIASGVNPAAKGMAPQAKVTAWYFDNDDAEMAALATPDQTTLLFSNHSYGQPTGWRKVSGVWRWEGDPSINPDEDYNFGFYGSRAQVLDQITYLAPYYTVVWAAGNDRAEFGNGSHPPDCNNGTGYDCIIPDASGKNIITVGAVNRVPVYTNPGSVVMSTFSSWGPTDDGRIKPDLVGDGVELFSLSASGTNTYGIESGTSMATPNVTGSLALLQELYSKLHAGNFMKAATLKALAIHTAREAGNFQGPDYSYGWGLLNADGAANLLLREDGLNTVIEESTLNDGDKKEWLLTPKANQKITATIVWTDPAGQPVERKIDPVDLMLVNDLDIKVTDDLGNEFFPWILDPGNPAQKATKGNNFRDNVERLEVDAPLARSYKLTVSHKAKLTSSKQDFSLILSYQSTNSTAQTFYWIGDTGDWNDPAHWSLNSGGVSADKVPAAMDYVIVDENSFDGTGSGMINFSQDQSIGVLKWLTVKVSGVSLNNNKLNISRSLTIGSSDFNIYSAGDIVLTGTSAGTLSFSDNDFSKANVIVSGGNWIWLGKASVNKLALDEGTLELRNTNVKVNSLVVNSDKIKKLTLVNSRIDLIQNSLMAQTNFTLNATGSALSVASSQVIFDWNNILWNGDLVIDKASVVIKGNNNFSKIELNGQLEFTGSNQMDSLKVAPGSEILLGANTNQVINEPEFDATALSPVKLLSNSSASFTFSHHKKYCFDYLQVVNVEAKGIAVFNAGVNGVLSNAKGWLSQKCDDVLYANFDVSYPCENALVKFNDKSTGVVKQWIWTFPGAVTIQNQRADFPFSKAGKYPVTLTVNNGSATNSYTGEIVISANTLSENQIVVNSNELFSFRQSTSYQWYKDNNLISGETKRSYAYQGDEGIYYVINYNETCNRISDLTTITGIAEVTPLAIKFYPNPADDQIVISNDEGELSITIMDSFGRTMTTIKSSEKSIVIFTDQLADGIYLMEAVKGDRKFRDKILIKHK